MEEQTESRLTSAFDSPTFGEDTSFKLDKPVGSMSISPCGRDVVLASRQGLHIIDLDTPWAPPRYLPHVTPWEVADVQWSPFAARDYWIISTSNQKALVWNLEMSDSRTSIEHVLHAHTRAITDINFSAHHPDVLATCAVDSFVHCWDLRHPARPVVTFCDWFAGATQVKWNRQDPHIVASSHDRFLRIWDDRKGAYPLRSIEAHDTKIYGIDWNRTSPNRVLTCSLDKTIKFWDYSSEIIDPEYILQTPFPVWRARHTPFGRGILAMPQRGNNDLHLYKRFQHTDGEPNDCEEPIHRFEGHQDQVKEFLWRPRGTINEGIDGRDFQLVSWGADRMLRLHRVDEQTLAEVGYVKDKSIHKNLNVTRKNAIYKTFRDDTAKTADAALTGIATSTPSNQNSQNRTDTYSVLSWGMKKPSKPGLYSWGGGAFMSSKPNMSSGAIERKDIDPLVWMKGVKIGKRETGLDQSAASISSPSLRATGNWDVFESLGEEITHVADRFSKVTFDKIDVQNRFIKLSLSGPWGLDDATVYLQSRFLFPFGYPNTATPNLSIERTTSVDATVLTRLITEVKVIAQAYMSCQRGSLEALIRYLQGEQTVEEATAWTKEDQVSSVLELVDDGPPSSSDEEDDDFGVDGYDRTQMDETGLGGSGLLGNSNNNANVPLPKACGAVWADNGCLICFFPIKEDITQSIISSLRFKGTDMTAKGQAKLSSGFGRLHSSSPVEKWRTPILETIDGDDSGSDSWSDESCSSPSSSSASSRDPDSPRRRLAPPYAWRSKSFNNPHVESMMEDSQRSSGSVSLGRAGTETSKNIVSIHNLESLLPIKRTLAQQYLTSGPVASAHNVKVAEAENNFELADAWFLIDMILHEEVPVEETILKKREPPVLVVATRSLRASERSGRVASWLVHSEERRSSRRTQATIKWGQHPLGSTGLVADLFSYFEQLGDIQMLAMMSCILSDCNILREGRRADRPILRQQDSSAAYSISEPKNVSSTAGSRDFYVDYHQSYEVAISLLQPTAPKIFIPSNSGKPGGNHPSAASSLGASHSGLITPFSTGVTPPYSYMPGRRSLERIDSNSKSLSTSPEQLRTNHRSNSNLTAAFVSISRPFSFSTSASSSPPSAYLKKGVSPVGSHMGAPASNITSGPTSGFRRSFSAIEEPKLGYNLQGVDINRTPGTSKEPKIKIQLKNQDLFHNEGYARVPLLDPKQASRYRVYREAYAHLLLVWNMLVTKTEVLKCNGNSVEPLRNALETVSIQDSSITIGRKVTNPSIKAAIRENLAVRRKGTPWHRSRSLDPSMDACRCRRCASKEIPLICVFCAERIRGLAIPCLVCGHVMHPTCRSILLSIEPSSSDGSTFDVSCDTGCGCQCGELSSPEMELPEESAHRSSATSTIREESFEEGREWGEEEGVAYESLAKNLGAAGAKFVRPKPSRIWRGFERKESNQG